MTQIFILTFVIFYGVMGAALFAALRFGIEITDTGPASSPPPPRKSKEGLRGPVKHSNARFAPNWANLQNIMTPDTGWQLAETTRCLG